MKKIILLAAFGIAGLVSAKGNVEKKVNSKGKEITVVKKAKKKLRRQCATVVVSCTSAYTCQDWSADQWLYWATQIQNNYCMIDSPYNP
ncbi:hypothetical protein [Chryseobacterium wanjuense]